MGNEAIFVISSTVLQYFHSNNLMFSINHLELLRKYREEPFVGTPLSWNQHFLRFLLTFPQTSNTFSQTERLFNLLFSLLCIIKLTWIFWAKLGRLIRCWSPLDFRMGFYNGGFWVNMTQSDFCALLYKVLQIQIANKLLHNDCHHQNYWCLCKLTAT